MSKRKFDRARAARAAGLRLEALEDRVVLNGTLQFDFGTAISPVAASYTRATEAAYAADARHGWLSGEVGSIDRGVGADLTRDVNWGRNPGVFAADLANGDYRVSVTVGDTAARDDMAIDLEGQRRDVLRTAAGQSLTRSYDVTVADGQLTLRLADLGGSDEAWSIQALVIEPLAGPLPANAVQVIDDGDAGFSRSGSWDTYSGVGHGNDFTYSLSGAGADTASWAFAVAPGQYKVSATWVARPNRAADAPYTVLDGGNQVGLFRADQRQAPADFSDGGTAWEDLGTVTIAGSSLVVRLSDAAGPEYVIADAVRVERIGDPSQVPEIQVLEGTADIADGTGSVSFGSAAVGAPVSKTFTVRNNGTAVLTLGPSVSVPAGFTVTTGFGSTSLAAGASTTFTVRLDAAAAGSYSGEVSFTSNDADESPFNFTVSGTVTSAPPPPGSGPVQVLDDGDAGFSATAGWEVYSGEHGRGNDFRYKAAGAGADMATWAFDVSPGRYRVSTTWVERPNRATNAAYTVLDGQTAVGSAAVDQRQAPNDFAASGSAWEDLATVQVAGGRLVVTLSDAANGLVVADAVRIERVDSQPPAPAPTPAGLTARTLSTSEVLLRWAGSSSAFKVERSLTGTDGWSVIATTAAGATSYTDTGLQAGRTYHYRVRATTASGDSAPSAVAQALTFERVVFVNNSGEMYQALRAATPGTAVLMRPGVYAGDNYFANVQGVAGRPIVLAAADPNNQPIFRGGGEALHFTDSAYLELWDFVVEGQSSNGINIDDGDSYETPSHHLTLRGLTVRDINPSGNHDGIKLSGVDHFLVTGCTIIGWGGSGIDMVGCHHAVIEKSLFRGGVVRGSHGLEAKGGSSNVTIRDNRFENAGDRAVQLGGATGLNFFRPRGVLYEARDLLVEGNVIIGSDAAIAFVNIDGSTVRYNTIIRPATYVMRILQETRAPGFVPSRNGVFTDNIVYRRSNEASTAVNIGSATAPETFVFARNWWYCFDRPELSRPSLPAPESNGTYGIDPQFVDVANGDYHLRPGSPASAVGAYAPRP